ncbi:hypothetical protein HKW97_24695 (plasmid) [Pseudomonas luteola]
MTSSTSQTRPTERTNESGSLQTYWKIGLYILEFGQGGRAQAKHEKYVLPNLPRSLIRAFGKGFAFVARQ